MAAKIPEKFRDLLTTKKAFAHLATVSPNGQPQVTPVWIDTEGDLLRVNSAKGRVKDRNMTKGAKVALSLSDPDDPYRHLSVRGRVVEVTSEGADAHIDSLAKKYMGVDRYPLRKPDEQRVIYKIALDTVATMG